MNTPKYSKGTVITNEKGRTKTITDIKFIYNELEGWVICYEVAWIENKNGNQWIEKSYRLESEIIDHTPLAIRYVLED